MGSGSSKGLQNRLKMDWGSSMGDKRKNTICAVVVTYNRKKLLGECLDALLHQTRPLDSIIVIDNASTDGTYEYLNERRLINFD